MVAKLVASNSPAREGILSTLRVALTGNYTNTGFFNFNVTHDVLLNSPFRSRRLEPCSILLLAPQGASLHVRPSGFMSI